MILNAFALTSLFVGIISLVLILTAAVAAAGSRRELRISKGSDARARAEDRIHLCLLLLFTAFLLRLMSWPLFYMLLHSLIPLVPGAMCIFGVTRVMPGFVAFLQVLKPLAFFLIGGWLIFYRLDLDLKRRFLIGKGVKFLLVASAVALVDTVAELLFVFLFTPPGVAVSCCTAVGDLAIPPAPLLPIPLFGARYEHMLLVLYHCFNLGIIAVIGFLLWKKPAGRLPFNLVVLSTFMNGAISYGAFKECLGPHLMRLPDHHCLYCLLQYRPISVLILGFFILGSFFAVWPFLLRRAVGSDDVGDRLILLNLNLLKYALVFLLASWFLTLLGILGVGPTEVLQTK